MRRLLCYAVFLCWKEWNLPLKIYILTLAAVLVGAGSNPPAFAQDRETQQRRTMKSRQEKAERLEKHRQSLKEIQPPADRYAEAMITHKYSDSLVQGYVSSLGSIEEMQIALVGGLNIFTYNGDNRRPARSAAEYRAIRATGIVTCKKKEATWSRLGLCHLRQGRQLYRPYGGSCHQKPKGQHDAWPLANTNPTVKDLGG